MAPVAGRGARGAGTAGSPERKPQLPPRIGRKDLQDPDRDVPDRDVPDRDVREPDRPVRGDEKPR